MATGYDVFISHSSHDKQVAEAVCAAMEGTGLRCWIAPRDITAGASWGSAIIDGIETSRLMLLVFSRHANTSAQVLREVERAVAKDKPLVPLRLDATPVRKDLEYFLAACPWTDATGGALEDHLAGLTAVVRRILLERAEAHADGPRVAEPLPAPAARKRRPPGAMLAAAAAVVSLGIAVVAAVMFASRGAPPVPSAATVPAAAPIDLLAPLRLPDDVVSGDATRSPDGVIVTGPFPARLRFAAPPPGDYDVRVRFTPTAGDKGFGIILTRFGNSLAYGWSPERGYHVEKVGRNSHGRVVLPQSTSIPNGKPIELVAKLRATRIDGYIDGEFLGDLLTHYDDIEVPEQWRVGDGVLGFVASRDVTIHSAEVIPVRGEDLPAQK